MRPHTGYRTPQGILLKAQNLSSHPHRLPRFDTLTLGLKSSTIPNDIMLSLCVFVYVRVPVCVKVKCLWLLVNHLCPQDSWEIVEGLRGGGLSNFLEPQKQEGYMLKRRKWPMKGWHKVQPNTQHVLKTPMLPHLQWQISDRWGIFRHHFTTTSFYQSYLTLSRFLLQLKAADMALLSINLIEWAYSVDHPQRSHMWPGSMLSLKAFSGMTLPRYLGIRAEMH